LHPKRPTKTKNTSTPVQSAAAYEKLLSIDFFDIKPSSFDPLLDRRFRRLFVNLRVSPLPELMLVSLSCHTSFLALRC
jgi:hypothetical protein